MHQETLDYEKQFKYEFGQYGQGHNDDTNTKNTPAPHTIDCIYLRPLANKQGGHELLDLATGAVITRNQFTEIPVTPEIIKVVEDLGKADGMEEEINFKFKTGQINSGLIAGVDDEEEDGSDDDDYNFLSDDEDNEDEELDYDSEDSEEDEDYDDVNESNEDADDAELPDREPKETDNADDDQNTQHEEEEIIFEQQDDDEEVLFEMHNDEEEEEEPQQELRRSTREVKQAKEAYVPSMTGKTYQHLSLIHI